MGSVCDVSKGMQLVDNPEEDGWIFLTLNNNKLIV